MTKIYERNERNWFKGPKQDNEEYLDDEELEGDRDEQIFDFVEILSFVTLLTGVNTEPLYFLKITEKEISDRTIMDTWSHAVRPGLSISNGTIWNPFAHETNPPKNSIYCLCLLS